MQATRSPQRVVVAAILAVMLVAGFAGVAGSACQARPKATGEAATGRTGPAALAEVETFAEALGRGQDLNYSGEYATADGITVTVAQAPPRRAYRTTDDAYFFGPDAAYLCHLVTCQHVPGADTMPLDQAQSVASAFGGVFVIAEHAAALLARAAALPGARATRAQRVVAGAPVDCIAVITPAGTTTADTTTAGTALTGCVNAAGVLAYFDGTTEEAAPVRIELRQYAPTVAPDAFNLPPDAKTVDVDALGISE